MADQSPVQIATAEPIEFSEKENSKPNTVIADPSKAIKTAAFNGVKHPLRTGWTLWYDAQLFNGKKPAQWGENMKEVYSFSTVEDFWRMYNNLALASQIQQGCSFNLFKKGIEPKWEDPKNEKGGKWTIMIPKSKPLDTLWLWLMLACIGEVLEDEGDDQICGCVVNIRKGQDKLGLWTRDEDAEAALLRMGQRIKKTLELSESDKIGFQGHFTKNARQNKFEI